VSCSNHCATIEYFYYILHPETCHLTERNFHKYLFLENCTLCNFLTTSTYKPQLSCNVTIVTSYAINYRTILNWLYHISRSYNEIQRSLQQTCSMEWFVWTRLPCTSVTVHSKYEHISRSKKAKLPHNKAILLLNWHRPKIILVPGILNNKAWNHRREK